MKKFKTQMYIIDKVEQLSRQTYTAVVMLVVSKFTQNCKTNELKQYTRKNKYIKREYEMRNR